VVIRGNGAPARHKCWLSSIRNPAGAIKIEGPQKSLKNWTDQKWRTKSGKPSTQGPKATGERYLPESAIKSLSSAEYAATSRAKRAGKAKGKQFVKQPKSIARKTARHR
jgi:hypothetical protein